MNLLADQKKLSDQKRVGLIGGGVKGHQAKKEEASLNYCCLFCNNKLVYEAVKKGDIHAVKKLLNDYDNITNPF